MMNRISIFHLLFISLITTPLFGGELSTEIQSVMVYINGAQITRTGSINLKPGKTTIQCKGISPYVNNQSLTVKGTGDFTILSTALEVDFETQKVNNKKLDSLDNAKLVLVHQKEKLNNRLFVLQQMETLIIENKTLSSEQNPVSASNLKEMLNLYETKLLPVTTEKNNITSKIDSLNKIIAKNFKQRESYTISDSELYHIINIEVEAKTNINANFTISYYCDGAHWYPVYDVRVNDLSEPLNLICKANVSQQTGENWENVQLNFSTGEPNVSGVAPILEPWYLNFGSRNFSTLNEVKGFYNPSIRKVSGRIMDENEEPLVGANIVVMGTTIGTVADLDGFYTINVPSGAKQLTVSYIGFESKNVTIGQSTINVKLDEDDTVLSEVVVSAFAIQREKKLLFPKKKEEVKKATYIESTTEVAPTVFTFKLNEPFTILSNDPPKTINLANYEIEADYTHYAVPKLDETAYLVANINNWNNYNLLQGEANVYFENTFVTETIINARSLNDTLSISLGPDRNIAIERLKDEDFCTTLNPQTNNFVLSFF